VDDLDRRIDAVFDAPLPDFIRDRDALAAELKAGGDADAAKRVKSLRKPVVPAWATNRLAHREPDAIAELLALGDRLRAAQRRAMSGGDANALREAMEERRQLVARLARRAADLAEGSISSGNLDEISATLEAASVDEEAGTLVREGRLTKPIRPPTSFAGGALRVLEGGRTTKRGSAPPAEPPAPSHDRDRDRDRERREAEKAREAERRRAAKELATAEAAERRAIQKLERAKEALGSAERKRVEAKEAVRAAEAELRGATLERKRRAQRSG
jgi:hypothetical protein